MDFTITICRSASPTIRPIERRIDRIVLFVYGAIDGKPHQLTQRLLEIVERVLGNVAKLMHLFRHICYIDQKEPSNITTKKANSNASKCTIVPRQNSIHFVNRSA